MVIETVRRLAEVIRTSGQPPMIPPVWDTSPGAVALRDSMAGVARVLARDWTPGDRTRAALHEEVLREEVLREEVLREDARERSGDPADGIRERILRVVGAGQISRTFVLRLMACMGVAGLVSEVLPLQRSYWVPLTVAIVLKPVGWRLAEERLVDTLIGCAIVVVVGFAPWPMAWYAHLPGKFAQAALDVCAYMRDALGGSAAPGAAARLRSTYRALGDLRAEFQRTMSEPPSISRGATAWWPATVGLEQVLDAVSAVSLAVGRGARVPSKGVEQLCQALDAVSQAASGGAPVPASLELPDDETLQPVTAAVRALLGVLASGERLGSAA
jgi:hypothetical protein